ncbi:hypothetical protein [Candidatus Mycobacterium methanotrophicum]|uniref:Uncharacterized protein n=1 Tax=Candidatus Mycobacterium methanotrophicum TaxID=2943498 RepID=A0ABY4QS05_9MYCO|nr:hypothetical protein [Candidatus Mycobacterium methanotrophicum]UQX13459.1 hypothetical protein M5I08_24970 [Candidatus Mycobacterium methanotrophicum]
MARYELVWSDVPLSQYRSLAPEVRTQIDETLDWVLDDPEQHGTYDKDADQWSTTFGGGIGLRGLLRAVGPKIAGLSTRAADFSRVTPTIRALCVVSRER